MDAYRTFIAIEVPGELRARIAQHIDQLRKQLPDVRASWSREDNLHLTLKFLGNVPVADVAKLSDAVECTARQVAPFEITLSGCGSFPPRGRPNFLWLGTQGAGLPELHSAIERECAAIGFPREARPYHPHLTIARLRKTQDAHRLADLHEELGFTPQSFTASEVIVFRSELLRERSRHTALSRHPLRP